MSHPTNMYPRKRAKSKQNVDNDKDINLINPDIFSYIQRLQNNKNKVKVLNQNKNQMPTQVERILTNKLHNSNGFSGLKEDIPYDKEKKIAAKKGLLLLLNIMSHGTFCPDIEDYFSKMKDAKIEELRKQSKINEHNLIIKKLSNRDLSSIITKTNIDEKKKNSLINKFKSNLGKKSEINEKYGFKKYDNDSDAEDMIYLYSKKDIKENSFQINIKKKTIKDETKKRK